MVFGDWGKRLYLFIKPLGNHFKSSLENLGFLENIHGGWVQCLINSFYKAGLSLRRKVLNRALLRQCLKIWVLYPTFTFQFLGSWILSLQTFYQIKSIFFRYWHFWMSIISSPDAGQLKVLLSGLLRFPHIWMFFGSWRIRALNSLTAETRSHIQIMNQALYTWHWLIVERIRSFAEALL